MSSWLLAYDIKDPGRLARVHRRMICCATPVEYSVFLLIGSKKDLQTCIDSILEVIDRSEDDVRCYFLPLHGLQERVGPPTLPEGIHWTGLPSSLM